MDSYRCVQNESVCEYYSRTLFANISRRLFEYQEPALHDIVTFTHDRLHDLLVVTRHKDISILHDIVTFTHNRQHDTVVITRRKDISILHDTVTFTHDRVHDLVVVTRRDDAYTTFVQNHDLWA